MKLQANEATRGFTLIELLVVIAIIGLLSSIVLASLSTARLKARDAAIQSQLTSIRTQAGIYYSNHNGTYGTPPVGGTNRLCTTAGVVSSSPASMFTDSSANGGLLELVQAIARQVNGTQDLDAPPGTPGTEAYCRTFPSSGNAGDNTVTEWAMAVRGATNTNFYCVDSSGTLKTYNSSTNPAASLVQGNPGAGAISSGATRCNN